MATVQTDWFHVSRAVGNSNEMNSKLKLVETTMHWQSSLLIVNSVT